MKRILSLILALITALSLPCMSGAAFTDAAGIQPAYADAVAAMSEQGIIAGFPDGTFRPDGTLTRAQAAKILCVMLEGAEKANSLSAESSTFTDVSASHWAAKFVEYCADKGIVAGVGGSRFDPDGKLTGLAFGKMLLAACGMNGADLTGAGWDTTTAQFLAADDLDASVPVSADAISRQEACKLAHNFMTAPSAPEYVSVPLYTTEPVKKGITRAEAEAALTETTWAYYMKGKTYQYDNQQFTKDIVNRYYGGNARLQYGAPPEDGTDDNYIYSVCSDYINKSIYNAWGYVMFGHFQEAVTEGLFLHAEKAGMLRIRWSNKEWGDKKREYFGISDESFKSLEEVTKFFEAWEQNFRPGDVIVMNGHTMMYVGDGVVLHAGGSKYDLSTGTDKVEPDGTRRYSTIRGLFFGLDGETTKSYRLANNKSDGYLVVLRPLDALVEKNTGSGTDKLKAEYGLTASALTRLQFPGMRIDRTADLKQYNSAAAGGEITYSIAISNLSNDEKYAKHHTSADYKALPVSETVPEGTELVEGSVTEGGNYKDGKITWSLNLAAGEEKTLSYKVKVTAAMGSIIKNDGGMVGNIPSNTLAHTVGGAKLNDTNTAKLKKLTAATAYGKDTDFAENIYRKLGISLSLPTTQQFVNNAFHYVNVGGKVGFTTMGDVSGDAWILTPNTESLPGFKTYGSMIVDGYRGGKGVYTYDDQKRIFDFWQKDLEIGDIVLLTDLSDDTVDRKVESVNTVIYLGDGRYLLSEDGKVSLIDSQSEGEAYLLKAFLYDFFILLRPSQAYADVNLAGK